MLTVQVAKTCKDKGAPEVATYSVDLGDSADLDNFAKVFQNDHKHCDVLVNCAGVMGQGSPTEGEHLPSPVHGTRIRIYTPKAVDLMDRCCNIKAQVHFCS